MYVGAAASLMLQSTESVEVAERPVTSGERRTALHFRRVRYVLPKQSENNGLRESITAGSAQHTRLLIHEPGQISVPPGVTKHEWY